MRVNAFDPKHADRWTNAMSTFREQVADIEATVHRFIDTSFHELVGVVGVNQPG
jgi:hypothetical protein